jgi:tetratricopeptide (TPR) repeat protein
MFMFGTDKAQQFKEQGNILFRQQLYDQALKCYRAAVELDSKMKEVWFNIGFTLKMLNKFEEALNAFSSAITIDPAYIKALWHQSDVLIKQGRFNEALVDLEQVLKIDSENLDALASKECCLDHIQAKVCAVTVDLKFTKDNVVKILSLKRALQTSFHGYDELNNRSMDELFRGRLAQLGLPFFINSNIGKHIVPADEGYFESTLNHGRAWSPKAVFDYSDLSTYRGIYGGYESRAVEDQVLLIDDSLGWSLVSENLHLMHEAFAEDLLCYRPVCKVYPRKYNARLAKRISNEIPGNKYVIYEPYLYNDKSLFIVDKSELNEMLQLLLAKDNLEGRVGKYYQTKVNSLLRQPNFIELEQELQQEMMSILSWSTSYSPFFMVEQYVPSKLLNKKGEKFDPTMRVALLLIRDKQAIKVIPIDTYWKLPECPFGKGELRDYALADFGGSIGKFSTLVSEHDKAIVFEQLTEVLPRVFINIFILDIGQKITDLLNSNAENVKYGKYLLMLRAGGYGHLGRFSQATSLINKAIALDPKNSKAYHERGLIYHRECQYQQAVKDFTKALSLEEDAATYYRRGKRYLEIGEMEKAMQDFLVVKEFIPDDSRIDVEIARIGQLESSKINSLQEMIIDLHGYSQENAKIYILHILANAQNTRKIRVITGKGNHPNCFGERGILYKEFHSWIAESEYQHRIEKITSHDGYYEIYLQDSTPQQNKYFKPFSLNEFIRDINPIKVQANQGDSGSQFLFANYLVADAKSDDNFKEAFKYYLRSAKQGNVKAMIEVATFYMVGRGTKQNDAKAINWLKKAIEFDKFHAPVMLGDCYQCGHGVPEDPKLAFAFHKMDKRAHSCDFIRFRAA